MEGSAIDAERGGRKRERISCMPRKVSKGTPARPVSLVPLVAWAAANISAKVSRTVRAPDLAVGSSHKRSGSARARRSATKRSNLPWSQATRSGECSVVPASSCMREAPFGSAPAFNNNSTTSRFPPRHANSSAVSVCSTPKSPRRMRFASARAPARKSARTTAGRPPETAQSSGGVRLSSPSSELSAPFASAPAQSNSSTPAAPPRKLAMRSSRGSSCALDAASPALSAASCR
mmetsp:Transcript_43022/g.125103  ORF Transcript_43022/g.125103 Transcript_43022/m.125103 type:complete len:234 (-) Transcript_43022:397-1098(-)